MIFSETDVKIEFKMDISSGKENLYAEKQNKSICRKSICQPAARLSGEPGENEEVSGEPGGALLSAVRQLPDPGAACGAVPGDPSSPAAKNRPTHRRGPVGGVASPGRAGLLRGGDAPGDGHRLRAGLHGTAGRRGARAARPGGASGEGPAADTLVPAKD